MAQSQNLSQVVRWGSLFDCPTSLLPSRSPPSTTGSPPTNRRSSAGVPCRTGRFCCSTTTTSAPPPRAYPSRRLLRPSPTPEEIELLVSLPERPKSTGLSLSEIRDQFGDERLARVSDLGFAVDDRLRQVRPSVTAAVRRLLEAAEEVGVGADVSVDVVGPPSLLADVRVEFAAFRTLHAATRAT